MLHNETLTLINAAYEVLKKIAPQHDPIKGHTVKTATEGSSIFAKDIDSVDTLLNKLDLTDAVDKLAVKLIPGRNGAVCISVFINREYMLGVEVKSHPVPGESYKIIRDHGDLIPSGKVQLVDRPTSCATFVLTEEKVDDNGNTDYALASVYPGKPDEKGNWDGIEEGSTVTAEELINRDIARVKLL